jgi:adenosine deaminase
MMAQGQRPETIPKIELHCHLDGIVDPPMLRELEAQGVLLPILPEALQAAYPVQRYDDFISWGRAVESLEGNTDDPGAFECSMTSECELLARTFGFQEADFRKIAAASLNARFRLELRWLEERTGSGPDDPFGGTM